MLLIINWRTCTCTWTYIMSTCKRLIVVMDLKNCVQCQSEYLRLVFIIVLRRRTERAEKLRLEKCAKMKNSWSFNARFLHFNNQQYVTCLSYSITIVKHCEEDAVPLTLNGLYLTGQFNFEIDHTTIFWSNILIHSSELKGWGYYVSNQIKRAQWHLHSIINSSYTICDE
jgi:hypothetical protein